MIYSLYFINELNAAATEHGKQTYRKLLVDRVTLHQPDLLNGCVIKYLRMISQSYKLIQTFIIV